MSRRVTWAARGARDAAGSAAGAGAPSPSEVWAQRLGELAGERARFASRAAAAERNRARRVGVAAASAGVAGLCCGLAALVLPPAWSATPFALLGLALLAAPVAVLARAVSSDAVPPETVLSAAAARSAATAAWAGRLARAIEAAGRDGATLAHLRSLNALLASVETDLDHVERATRPANRRRHRRIVPRHRRVIVRTPDGRRLSGNIADVSLSGVSLSEALPRVSVGEELLVGRHPAAVVRVWDKGVALQFTHPLDADTFDESIVL